MLVPDTRLRLLPASIDTFLPLILMSPLGALMVIPVKAFTATFPQGELILIERLSVEQLIFQMPYLSPISTPPSKAELLSSSPSEAIRLKTSGKSMKLLMRLAPGVKLVMKAVAPLPIPSCTLINSPLGAAITAADVFSALGISVVTLPTTKGRSTLLLA